MPVGIVPGGTSNGFAKVVCEESQEVYNAENCSYIIAKGWTKFIDVLEVETMNKDLKSYAFLSVSWGIIADSDLESES